MEDVLVNQDKAKKACRRKTQSRGRIELNAHARTARCHGNSCETANRWHVSGYFFPSSVFSSSIGNVSSLFPMFVCVSECLQEAGLSKKWYNLNQRQNSREGDSDKFFFFLDLFLRVPIYYIYMIFTEIFAPSKIRIAKSFIAAIIDRSQVKSIFFFGYKISRFFTQLDQTRTAVNYFINYGIIIKKFLTEIRRNCKIIKKGIFIEQKHCCYFLNNAYLEFYDSLWTNENNVWLIALYLICIEAEECIFDVCVLIEKILTQLLLWALIFHKLFSWDWNLLLFFSFLKIKDFWSEIDFRSS